MLGWILRLLLAVLAIRYVVRAVGRRRSPAGPRIAPTAAGGRAKAPRPGLSPYEIEDAEYEELPPR